MAEPSEARLRKVVLGLAAFCGAPALLALYYHMTFTGLTNPDAMDYAQLGRNLSTGHGFVTYILRPLALVPSLGPQQQPDVTHGPLFPFFLALGFGAMGVKDQAAAAVSGLFYLLTIPVIYALGKRAFNRQVGAFAALIFSVNALMLEYATSGLPISLYIFLSTSLFLTLYSVAGHERDHASDPQARPPRAKLVLAGLLAGALYLTEPIFFWVLPVVLAAAVLVTRRRSAGALWFGIGLAVLALPWMFRNGALTGNPVFGLRGAELWMHTQSYPGYEAYRMSAEQIVPGNQVFRDVLRKAMLNVANLLQTLPQVSGSWFLAFFLPSLLYRFRDPAANAVRKTMVASALALVVGSALFAVHLPIFVSVVPTMLVFALAYLLYLLRQANLPRSSSLGVAAVLTLVAVYPLIADVQLRDRARPPKEAVSAVALQDMSQKDEVVFSDQPWITAWYARRASVWLPSRDSDVKELRARFPGKHWALLTERTGEYSPGWRVVYDQLHGYNEWHAYDSEAQMRGQPADAVLARAGTIRLDVADLEKRNRKVLDSTPLLRSIDGATLIIPKGMRIAQKDTVLLAIPKMSTKVVRAEG